MTPQDAAARHPQIATNLARLNDRVAAACERAGRDPDEVVLLGVSKLQPLAKLLAAYYAGLRTFGENRVQEAATKAPELPDDVDWHLIGPLQSNKAKDAAGLFTSVHSIDRVKIARALDRHAGESGRRLRCFLEINLGAEESKHGFTEEQAADALAEISELTHLELVGWMAIPPFADDPEESRPWFRQLRELRDRVGALPAGRALPRLSMGMSGDFEVAIEEGATDIRVGTALFGKRPG